MREHRTATDRALLPSLIAALLVFITAGYFHNSRPGWNVNSQFALTVAIGEKGTLRIDDYHDHPSLATGDKAFFEGHFYSDKSPVVALLGVPAFALYRVVAHWRGEELDYDDARYWTTWLTMGVFAAIFAFLASRWFMRHGVDPARASVIAGLWVMATPLIGYSILFYNYMPACAMALGGYLLVEPFLGSEPPCERSFLRLLGGGFLLGLASWTLSTFALLALIITIALATAAFRRSPREVVALWPWAFGGILGASGYIVYSLAIFGEVTNPYRYEFDENFRRRMSEGLMGAGRPDLRVLFMITLHPFRGLFVLFPVTAIAAIGAVALMVGRFSEPTRVGSKTRPTAIIAFAFLIGLLIYNSGYFMWWGGWTYAPRHLIPALALLPIGLLPILHLRRRWTFIAVISVTIIGAVLNLSVIALDPQPPPGHLTEQQLYEPGTIDEWPVPFIDMLRYVARGQTDFNEGWRVGLRGFWSLVPLAIIWAAGCLWIYITASRGRPPRPSPPPSPRGGPADPNSPPENPPA